MPSRVNLIITFVLASFLLAGCGQKESTTSFPIEPSPTPLPADTSIRPKDGMQMTLIPSGIPHYGSEPVEGFWIDQTNITNLQYAHCVDKGICAVSLTCDLRGSLKDPTMSNNPIMCAHWSDAKTYCEWAGGRLPTEAEWEVAIQQLGEGIPPWGDTQYGFRCIIPTVLPAEYWPTQGWITSSLEEQDMDPGLVAEGIKRMEFTFPNPHSLLIVRHGFLVVEEYYPGNRPNMSQDIASVNKSFLSALIGIAIDQGAIPGINQKMMDYFPEYSLPDARAYEITIEQLLTMTSGFYWPENEPIAPGFIDDAFTSGKPQDTLLRSPIVSTPGSTFNYCTACTHVLSIILQDSTGMPPQDFAQEYLMDPLGISRDDWSWNRIAYGYNTGGWGFYLCPRDMAKFGYLYLHNGYWDGEQVIPEEWVRLSRTMHINLGKSYPFPGQSFGYGYLWWTTNVGGHPAYYAVGHGGQYIYILPTLDMVIVITQRTESHNPGDPYEVIKDYFAAAVLDE